MAKWREREHILNRFPSSVRDVFMWRTKPALLGPAAVCIYTASMLLERLRLFFLGESLEFKRFKAISQEGGASDCRPSNTDRPTTLSLFLASRALSFTVALDPFSPLLASFSRSDCDLLRTFNRTMPALPEKGRFPFGATNFGRHEKWCGQPAMIRNTSRLVSS